MNRRDLLIAGLAPAVMAAQPKPTALDDLFWKTLQARTPKDAVLNASVFENGKRVTAVLSKFSVQVVEEVRNTVAEFYPGAEVVLTPTQEVLADLKKMPTIAAALKKHGLSGEINVISNRVTLNIPSSKTEADVAFHQRVSAGARAAIAAIHAVYPGLIVGVAGDLTGGR